jgi:hypothetical protein
MKIVEKQALNKNRAKQKVKDLLNVVIILDKNP